MIEYVNVNNKEYKFVIGNSKDDKYRKSFNALTEKIFGFNFEQWYQNGYMKNQYIPYSLMNGEKVISNVSVNLMDMNVFGKSKRLIQLGTVMTDEAYRNQGLNKVILDKVITDWHDKCDYIYLFANDSVLNFYPKFGFRKVDQYQCNKIISQKVNGTYIKKLDMSDSGDRELVYNKAYVSTPIAKISMIGNAELIMFYCITFMKDNIYYIQEYDTIVIANYQQDILEVFGVFCTEEVSLDSILDYLAKEDTKRVKLFFTPKEIDSYITTPLEGEDTLFILGEDTMLLSNEKFMFPSLSHT